jgi:putative ABC transport system permease protein
VAPVVVAAALAAPAFGLLAAARATRDRRVPANRSARRWARHTGRLRRAAGEAAVLAAAIAALVALHQRSVLHGLPAAAPTLTALAGALILLRLLPPAAGVVLRIALRSRRPLAVFSAARAATTTGRALPLLALVTAVALASFALTVDATVRAGLADGAWRTVGADARLDVAPDAESFTAEVAGRLAAAPGVRHAVAARVTGAERIVTDETTVSPVLVVVDSAAFRRLLRDTPLPDEPALDRLTAPGTIPALVRSADGALRPGIGLDLLRQGAPAVRLTAVGTAPAVNNLPDLVIVDAASGVPAVPNTIWLTGPGAPEAAATAGVEATTVLRTEVLRARRDAPLVAGLLALAWASAATLLALALLGLVLGAAASAPGRWQTLTRLRTLGLRPAEARRVAMGELLPAVAVAAVGGALLGVLLARVTSGPLMLRLLTSQSGDPQVVPPWGPLAVLAGALLVGVAVVVPVESALRRRRRLGEVLRAGE